ncbi:MAG: PAS domain S-box protein [Pseudobdellovibrionaceae bacterium]|jgi:PAS domain S-box-containing protein|nr:PAS domain S-box protein [Pseudobdellovibrionaceae bacterium]
MKGWNQRSALSFVSVICASFSTIIGGLVAVMWHIKTTDFVAKNFWIFYMQHTTALLLLLSGVGLIVAIFERVLISRILGSLIVLVSSLILFEYISGLNWGIEQILKTDDVHKAVAFPGRPAPNTLLAFLFIGISLLLMSCPFQHLSKYCYLIIDFTGFVVFALGAHAIGGYLESYKQAYAWGTDARMSIPTSISNVLMGIGLLAASWAQRKNKIASVPLWVPVVICFLALQFSLLASPGVVISVAFVPLVFCSIWFSNPLTVFVFASVSTFFCLLRYFLLPEEFRTQDILINQFLAVSVIWFTAILIFWKRIVDSKLEESERYLKAIVDHTMEGLIVVDTHGLIVRYNKSCGDIFGYRGHELDGKSIFVLMPERYEQHHAKIFQGQMPPELEKIVGIGREVTGRRKDGSEFPLEIGISEMVIDGNVFFSGILRDITARKEAEEKLLRSNAELERFAYVAAHDLQEPLRIVSKSLEFLQEDYADQLEGDGERFIRNATGATHRMRTLIQDLLEYSRLGDQADHYEDGVPLQDCLQIATDNLKEAILSTGAKIDIVGNFPAVTGNRGQLSRLYQNLIGNALKYRRPEVSPHIRIVSEQTEGGFLFCIEDNGIGIEAQYLDQIFQPFKRLHTIKEYPGSGIGLSVCKRIVEFHRGRIWVESEPGKGSRFFFTISS